MYEVLHRTDLVAAATAVLTVFTMIAAMLMVWLQRRVDRLQKETIRVSLSITQELTKSVHSVIIHDRERNIPPHETLDRVIAMLDAFERETSERARQGIKLTDH